MRRLVWLLVPFVAVCAGIGIATVLLTDPRYANGPGNEALSVVIYACLVFDAVIACLLITRVPRNPIGWVFAASSLLLSISVAAGAWAAWAQVDGYAGYDVAATLDENAATLGFPLAPFIVPILFPDGRPPTPRFRWAIGAVLGWSALSFVFNTVRPALWTYKDAENPLAIEPLEAATTAMDALSAVVLVAFCACNVAAVVIRWRRANALERQQLKWLAVVGVAIAFSMVIGLVGDYVEVPGVEVMWAITSALCVAGLPAAVAIAILQHGLYEVDLVLNRTLLWGALTALVIGGYAAVVVGLGALVADASPTVVSLIATGIVAVLFEPLRRRVQRAVNRLTYGVPEEPYAALTRVADHLAETPEPDAVLPGAVEAVATALRRPYAAIALAGEEGLVVAAEWGVRDADPIVVPLRHRGSDVGRLLVGRLRPGEQPTADERRLLGDVARQVAAAVQAVRLTYDLRRSREGIVAAREEERRRLRRDLHDGLGPSLAGVELQLGAARRLLERDPARAAAALRAIAVDANGAVADVRRLVSGLRPPTLDDFGLAFAIREQAGRLTRPDEGMPLAVEVEVDGDLQGLPAAVEVATYRIAQEALTNVARHAAATRCVVRLSRNGALVLVVEDDGVGLTPGQRAGVGLVSMRERAAELGGSLRLESRPARGTLVHASIPLPGPDAHAEEGV